MADQSDFEKPDGASNYSSEVWPTVAANIAAAGSMTPGARANVPTGFLRRSTPAAKHLVIEFWTGSAWSTLYDSRDLGGGILINSPASGNALSVTNGSLFSPGGNANGALRLQGAFGGGLIFDDGGLWGMWCDTAGANLRIGSGTSGGFSTRLSIAAPGNVTINAPSSGAALTVQGLTVMNAAASNVGLTINANAASWSGLQLSKGGTGKWLVMTDNAGADLFSLYAITTTRQVLYVSQAGNVNIEAPSSGAALTVAGDQHLTAATPRLIHRTGGQNVSEIAMTVTTGSVTRGRWRAITRRTDGSDEQENIAIDGYSGGGTGVTMIAKRTSDAAPSFLAINSDDAGSVLVSMPSGAALRSTGNVVPTADNAVTCGASGNRWSAVWAANGTIQTSDARDKADVEPIDPAKAHRLLQLLAPMTFRWLVGGRRVEEVADGFDERTVDDVEEFDDIDLVPATESVEVTDVSDELEMVDGRAVLRRVERKRTEERPIGEWVDVVDENGQPVMEPTGEQREVGRGRNKRSVPVLKARRHFVPRLIQVTVKKQRNVQRIEKIQRFKRVAIDEAGRRFHAGFIAQDVRRALTEAGLDRAGQALGLWVSSDPSDELAEQSLRPDQFLPLIVAAYRFQDDRLSKVEQQIGDLNRRVDIA